MKEIVFIVGSIFFYLLGVSLAWMAAWVFNPDIDSGTVWFFGFLVGALLWSDVRGELEKEWERLG